MRRMALCLVLCLPGSAGAGLLDKVGTLQKVGKKAADLDVHIDEKQERSLGRAVSANLAARFGVVEDEALERYVVVLGNYLASLSERPELPFRFAVLASDEVNAFAAPGGYIFVTRGTLRAAQDESELGAVLAHEIAHVVLRHGVKSIEGAYRKKVITSGLAELAASATGADPKLVEAFGALTDELTENLIAKGYSKDAEFEADRGGLRLAAAAGYDPEGMVRYLERLAAARGESTARLAKTHPKSSDRVAALRKELQKSGLGARPEARFAELYAAVSK